jgi:nicotinamidase-related amidase
MIHKHGVDRYSNMLNSFQLDPADSILAIIDIQERLTAAMPGDVGKTVAHSAAILVQAAQELHIPVILTEQYPRGLGPTVAEIAALSAENKPIEKLVFNCCRQPAFSAALAAAAPRKSIILCGIESHVCVLQTALGLLEKDYRVFIAADAVGSRTKFNWKMGLELLRQAGAVVGSAEIFLFQWLGEAGTEPFKKLSKLVK